MTDLQIFHEPSTDLLESLSLPTGSRGQPIYANGKSFYVVLENCKYQTPSSYGDKSYLTFELPDDAADMIRKIEDSVVHVAKRDTRFAVLDNVKMTPKTWEKYWRPSVTDDGLFKLSLKDTTDIFNYSKEPTSLGFMTPQSTVNLLVTPTNFWCMADRVGISWTVQQIRLLSKRSTDATDNVAATPWVMEDDDEY